MFFYTSFFLDLFCLFVCLLLSFFMAFGPFLKTKKNNKEKKHSWKFFVGWLVFVSTVQQVIRKLTSTQFGSHNQKLIFM